ncbi:hypothetical protein DMB66_41880 [Actinoplanes sp. ATCC 53533]|uniref:alkaline phosphatase family protein n=1 Tax=Actinoplanes sp. ATCC 53533 TaxID=1288362 RepID=UPI000F774853|nr:alkaline phosphatase family protein [Actinoplanes sp. ATCC 53533]RSM51511.1 hypothetical protein DMB66_41880 [Actinoplanes sp. ATCC 53533]
MFDGTWLSPDDLSKACALDAVPGLRPHRVQSLRLIPSLLLSCWDRPTGAFSLGHTRTVIVLATDGIGWSAAERCWSPDLLAPLTSTFPSTSTAAWLTATTGVAPTIHGVPGPVYRARPEVLFNCVTDQAAGRITDWTAQDTAVEVDLPSHRTVFEELSDRGASVTALPGDLTTVPGRWADAVLRGATAVAPGGDWPALSRRPVQAVRSVVEDVDAVVAGRPGAGGRLVWAFVHLDPYIHRHGYDGSIDAALARLDQAARRWSRSGHTVVAHADHGLTRTRPTPAVDMMTAAGARALCRLPAGGAGRTRWWYPKPSHHGDVLAAVGAALGEDALVVPAGRLVDLGLVATDGVLLDRIGEVVAIALGDRFPLVDPADRYEHGSLTADEMLAPLAVWAPDH